MLRQIALTLNRSWRVDNASEFINFLFRSRKSFAKARIWRIVKAWHGIESWLQIKKVFVCQNGVHLIFFCSKEEYKQFWCHYFDLDFDYRSYEKAIDADDNYLKSAFAYGKGIRILNQDPWEMLINLYNFTKKKIFQQYVKAV